ncbi:MAG: DUF2520 domain-containing protein [Bacteroidales bacterium]|nr:DUF2520 domain-containing protein [Bacteroidales bacterium]
MKEFKISFIGAGKVAGALCRQLHSEDFSIRKIVSATGLRGKSLARSCNAEWSQTAEFNSDEDLIIAAVPDDRLPWILHNILCPAKTIVAHTAGSIGLDVFPASIKNKGVFYPLQTFSENRLISFKELPFFLEASDSSVLQTLRKVALRLGAKVYETSTDQRKMLHLAAVFACNFTNHMLSAGKTISGKAGFSFDILKPLINETIIKAFDNGPEYSQTGPAFRNDTGTIKRHIDLLSFSPELQGIYREITQSIIKLYNNDSDDQL